jgi:outer membrane lipoprotein-sorting protein
MLTRAGWLTAYITAAATSSASSASISASRCLHIARHAAVAYRCNLRETGGVRGFVAIAIVLTAVRVQAQPAPSATTVLANVQKYYAGTQQLTAEFRQYVTNATFHTTSTADGSLWLLRPGSYRFDFVEKRKTGNSILKSFVFDGTTRWVVDHKHRQLIKNPGPDPAVAALVFFESSLSTRFDVVLNPSSRFGGAGSVVLELTPKQASAGTRMLSFVVNTADWHVTESIVVDDAGNTNDFSFNNTSLVRPVRASLFQLAPSSVPRYKLVAPAAGLPPPPATAGATKTSTGPTGPAP